MGKLTRLVLFGVGLLSLFGGAAATAGAVTWHNTGSTSFTATTGPQTLSSTSASWNCTGGTLTGDMPLGSIVAATYLSRGTMTYSGCSLSGIATGVDCSYTLTATTQTGSQTTGEADMACGWYQFGSKLCNVAGSMHFAYANPVGGVGTLTLTTGGSLITTQGAPGAPCPLGNGDRTHQSVMTLRTTSANPPAITRTA